MKNVSALHIFWASLTVQLPYSWIYSLGDCIFCSILFFAYRKQFLQYAGGDLMLTSKPKISKSFWRPKQTLSATFCCLAEPSRKTPTIAMLVGLAKEKLDRKRICFANKKGLEEEYPNLVSLKGTFQLFRALSGGSCVRELAKISVGSCARTIPCLKFDCKIPSCCVYVVSCQMKLSLESEI